MGLSWLLLGCLWCPPGLHLGVPNPPPRGNPGIHFSIKLPERAQEGFRTSPEPFFNQFSSILGPFLDKFSMILGRFWALQTTISSAFPKPFSFSFSSLFVLSLLSSHLPSYPSSPSNLSRSRGGLTPVVYPSPTPPRGLGSISCWRV